MTEIDARTRLEAHGCRKPWIHLEKRVSERTQELEEANTALRVLLSNVEQARQDYDQQFLRQIKGLVMPHLSRLRTRLSSDPVALTYLELMESSLKSISASYSSKLATAFEALTPAELEIAQMVHARPDHQGDCPHTRP